MGIVQFLGVVLVAGVELLFKSQAFGLFSLLLVKGCLALLAERLRVDHRLQLQLRPVSPRLHLPNKRYEQAHTDQAKRT